MSIYLELDGHGEMYRQLLRALRQAIAEGRLAVGARLPSTRALAQELGIARNTVLLAYEMLCAEHLAVSKVGSGTYVVRPPRRAPEPPAELTIEPQSRFARRLRETDTRWFRDTGKHLRFNLQYGTPVVDMGLFAAWGRALAHAAERTDATYPPTQGVEALRVEIASYLGRRRGLACEPDDVMVVNGTQQAIHLTSRVLLDEGDHVVLEDPSFKLARNHFTAHGAEVSFVPVDDEGMRVDRMPARPAKLIYVTPSHQYPSGVQMSRRRRHDLLALAREQGSWILEDDYDGEFGLEGRLEPALASLNAGGRVLYVGSFSKVLLPSIRLGYIVAPSSIREDLLKAKLLSDIASPGIEQAALAHFMRSGGFERHLRRAGAELRRRRAALRAAVQRWCPNDVVLDDKGVGMHCVAWLPSLEQPDVRALIEVAAAQGLGLHSINSQYLVKPRHQGLLLGFASLSVAQLGSAIELLSQCLAQVKATRSNDPWPSGKQACAPTA